MSSAKLTATRPCAGQLIAVAVVDILPRSLSSKYFFWDPGHAWLSPGRLSALLEIEWVRAAGAACPGLRYYMMGFYIATCPKMSYKVRRHTRVAHPRMLWALFVTLFLSQCPFFRQTRHFDAIDLCVQSGPR